MRLAWAIWPISTGSRSLATPSVTGTLMPETGVPYCFSDIDQIPDLNTRASHCRFENIAGGFLRTKPLEDAINGGDTCQVVRSRVDTDCANASSGLGKSH